MKILIPTIIIAAMSLHCGFAQEGPAEKAKDVAADTAETVKDTAKTAAKGVKKAAKEVTSSTHKVNVTMTEYKFEMPATAKAGKTEFVVKNAGQRVHTFAIKGNGIDQKISPNPKPGETATLTVDLTPGTYAVSCPVDFHTAKGMKTTLTVK